MIVFNFIYLVVVRIILAIAINELRNYKSHNSRGSQITKIIRNKLYCDCDHTWTVFDSKYIFISCTILVNRSGSASDESLTYS